MLTKILTSGFDFSEDDYELRLKYQLFNSMLLINLAFTLIASITRFLEGNINFFILNFEFSCITVVVIFLLRKYKNLFTVLAKFVVLFSFFTIGFALYIGKDSIVGVGWLVVILVFSIFLTDKKFSYFIFFLSISFIALITFLHQSKGYTIATAFYGVIPIIIGFFYLIFYEARNDSSKRILNHKNQLLYDLTHNLKSLVAQEVEKNRQHTELLARQSQSAALGEMMDAIAHQWIQPLSVIHMEIQSLVLKLENDIVVTEEDIRNTNQHTTLQVNHLVHTINEFRNFFRTNQEFIYSNIHNIILSTTTLLDDVIRKYSIAIIVEGDKSIEISCIPNEIKHIFINLINNAKDAFVENNIAPAERKIIFELLKDTHQTTINISDNAGGIPENIIDKIFQSNFTTKGETKGTGIGLYLSKQIVEKIKGTIEAKNKKDGVCFSITIPNQIH